MFKKILIANRGEIACRIVRTARKLGIHTIAVYSGADAQALHTRQADEAILIGPPPPRESYLDIERIIDAARKSGAEAIHPGYGFLAENGDFAQACITAGMAFIGPSPSAIRAMGSKSAAKRLMADAGLPLVPGYHGDEQNAEMLRGEAARIGYPVLIKPSAGGGGKGMRIVRTDTEFPESLAASQREAASSFGDTQVLLEKYMEMPRHIEIQVFGDEHGNMVYLFERDCSIQRRHQKIIEEAPAPNLGGHTRKLMGEAAITAARAVGYTGAGTVEFIVDQAGQFYFIEMNTRLQVEHPVTEMITGLDLVEWQIRVAAGEVLPHSQEQLVLHGHAIEARVCAEDPDNGFMPSTGKISYLALPAESRHVRIDAGVEEGDSITPFYDPVIAKLVVWDTSRDLALSRMAAALGQFRLAGITSNVEFLQRLIGSKAVLSADLSTTLIEREQASLFPADRPVVPDDVFHIAAMAARLHEEKQSRAAAIKSIEPDSPWNIPDTWRLGTCPGRQWVFRSAGSTTVVTVRQTASGYLSQLNDNDTEIRVSGQFGENGYLRARLGERQLDASVAITGNNYHVFLHGRHFCLACNNDRDIDIIEEQSVGKLVAPLPGRIVALLAKPGEIVDKGDPLLIVEAMKMEHTIVAPAAGTVRGFHHPVNSQVDAGIELVDFQPFASTHPPPATQ